MLFASINDHFILFIEVRINVKRSLQAHDIICDTIMMTIFTTYTYLPTYLTAIYLYLYTICNSAKHAGLLSICVFGDYDRFHEITNAITKLTLINKMAKRDGRSTNEWILSHLSSVLLKQN